MAQCAQERRNSDTGEGKKATGAGRN